MEEFTAIQTGQEVLDGEDRAEFRAVLADWIAEKGGPDTLIAVTTWPDGNRDWRVATRDDLQQSIEGLNDVLNDIGSDNPTGLTIGSWEWQEAQDCDARRTLLETALAKI